MDAARNGDYAAFERLVDKYADRIFLTGLRMCGDPGHAEEIVQETFLKAYSALSQYRGESGFFTWIFSIARNICMARFRHENTQPDLLSIESPSPQGAEGSDEPLQLPDRSGNPEDALLRGELRERLSQAILTLPEDQRLAFILRDFQGLSYNEVAEIMGKSVGAVKTDIHRARLNMRNQLAPYIVA